MSFLPAELIKKKRSGLVHSEDEILFLIKSYTSGELPDYQMAAWLMAVFFKGMTAAETSLLTEAMLRSGRVLDFSYLKKLTVDKHSTGGIGDKTSIIIAPVVAAAGVPVPMISGRGLGHTGGTLDKLEAIPGFSTSLSLDQFIRQIEDLGVGLIGQTAEICPADKKIYALRDVTGTVESLPLICASIMSKKLAEGIDGLVLDVKFGSGAFMKTLAQAEELADSLMAIGAAHGKRVASLVTHMDEPLGRFIGNALEIGECVAILKGDRYLGRNDFTDCRELSLELAAQMLWLGGRTPTPEDGLRLAQEVLASGKAFELFERLCRAQGGDLNGLPLAKTRHDVRSQTSGFVAAYNAESIGIAGLSLGAGRKAATDAIDPTAGIEVHKKIGDSVTTGEALFTLYCSGGPGDARLIEAERRLLSATNISLQKPVVSPLIVMRKVT
jgi:pyrimidine-nucleoside phosphorylase